MATPKISVVTPCYNLGPYLDETIASCLLQTFQDFEIILIDDGSDDPATRELLAEYRRPKTRLLSTPNQGLAKARNLGFRESAGEYLCFLDADDRLHPEFFEKASRVLDQEPDTTFVGCWIEAFGDESWTYRPEHCDLATVLAECTVATPALVRRTAMAEIGGYDEEMPEQGDEDWDLWIHLLSRGFTGRILPEVLFYYRRRRGSMVENCFYTDVHLTLMEYLFRKYAPFYEEHFDAVVENQQKEISELEANHEWLKLHLTRDVEPHLKRLCEDVGGSL